MSTSFFNKPKININIRPIFDTTDFLLYQTENCNWILTSKINAKIFKLPKDTNTTINTIYLNYMIKKAIKQGIQQAFVVSYPDESLGEFLSRIGFLELKI